MIGTSITITDVLASTVGELTKNHLGCAVKITWNDNYPVEIWKVTFLDTTIQAEYEVNDENGDVMLTFHTLGGYTGRTLMQDKQGAN